jgi:hypothetical protein
VSDYQPTLSAIILWVPLGPPVLIFMYRFWLAQYRRGWGLERKNGKPDLTFHESPVAYSFIMFMMISGTIIMTWGSFLIVRALFTGRYLH